MLKKILLGFLILSCFLVVTSFIYIKTQTYQAEYEDLTWQDHAEIDRDKIAFIVSDPKANIVFYPGGFVEYDAYAQLGYLLSLEGFNVYILKMPINLAILGVNRFNQVYNQNESDLPWYIGGHSLGGASASIYAIDHLENISGLFFLGAYPANQSDLSSKNIKVLSITASNDLILNQENFNQTKLLLPAHTEFVEIEGGNHSYF